MAEPLLSRDDLPPQLHGLWDALHGELERVRGLRLAMERRYHQQLVGRGAAVTAVLVVLVQALAGVWR